MPHIHEAGNVDLVISLGTVLSVALFKAEYQQSLSKLNLCNYNCDVVLLATKLPSAIPAIRNRILGPRGLDSV